MKRRNFLLAFAVTLLLPSVADAQRYSYYCYEKRADGKRWCFAQQCRWARNTDRSAAVPEIKAACRSSVGVKTRAAVKVGRRGFGRCNSELKRKCVYVTPAQFRERAALKAKVCNYGPNWSSNVSKWMNKLMSAGAPPRRQSYRYRLNCPNGRVLLTSSGSVQVQRGGNTYDYASTIDPARNPYMRANDRQTRFQRNVSMSCGSRTVSVTVHVFRKSTGRIAATKWQLGSRALTVRRLRASDQTLGQFLCGKKGSPTGIRQLINKMRRKFRGNNATPTGWRNAGPGKRG